MTVLIGYFLLCPLLMNVAYGFFDPTLRPDTVSLMQFQKVTKQETKSAKPQKQVLSLPEAQFVFKSPRQSFIIMGGERLSVGDVIRERKLVKIGKSELHFKVGSTSEKMPYLPSVLGGIEKGER